MLKKNISIDISTILSYDLIMNNIEITTETIDLENIIDDLVKTFPSVIEIYLFGSRAYRTNSTRSDIDLIVFSDPLIPPEDLRSVSNKYEYCDLFQGSKTSISSVVNGSTIERKNLIKTLDAIKLWDKKRLYQNADYYKQIVNKNQRMVPSLGYYPAQFKAFKAKINNPILSNYCKFYFQESMVEYSRESYIACVFFIGLSCEELIQDLVNGCQNKFISDNLGQSIDDWYAANTPSGNHRRCAKNNFVALENYFKNMRVYFKNNGFNKLDEMLVSFDVVRNYRNDADHPSDFEFEREYCDQLYASLSIHIDLIVNLINHLRTTFPY